MPAVVAAAVVAGFNQQYGIARFVKRDSGRKQVAGVAAPAVQQHCGGARAHQARCCIPAKQLQPVSRRYAYCAGLQTVFIRLCAGGGRMATGANTASNLCHALENLELTLGGRLA